MYRIRFREKAAGELQFARDYFILDRVSNWLKGLAQNASQSGGTLAADFTTFLEATESASEDIADGDWKRSLKKFRRSTSGEKVRAVIAVLRRREAPWQLAVAVTWFSGIIGTLDAEVHVYYEVDHVRREMVIVKFTGLPGQGG